MEMGSREIFPSLFFSARATNNNNRFCLGRRQKPRSISFIQSSSQGPFQIFSSAHRPGQISFHRRGVSNQRELSAT